MVEYIDQKECNICGSSVGNAEILFKLNSQQNLMKCRECGLLFNNRSRCDFDVIYGKSYYEHCVESELSGYFSYRNLENALKKDFKFAYTFLKKTVNSQVKLLEIGCGYGFFLKQFIDDGCFSLTGIEVGTAAAQEAQKFVKDIINDAFEDIELADRYDHIVSFEVIEHTINPKRFMIKASETMKPGGYFLLTTPNAGSLWFLLLKNRWPIILPDKHNYYFTPDTFTRLADIAGFDVFSIRKQPIMHKNFENLRVKLASLVPLSRHFLKLLTVCDKLDVPFFSGGRMEIILRKR